MLELELIVLTKPAKILITHTQRNTYVILQGGPQKVSLITHTHMNNVVLVLMLDVTFLSD